MHNNENKNTNMKKKEQYNKTIQKKLRTTMTEAVKTSV